MYNFDEHFKRYEEYDPKVPVWCLTPNDGFYTHRFFDTIPLSPSGRYLAVLKMPFEHKLNEFGDEAEIVTVDLFTGEEKSVYKTKAWQHQLGANINWGMDDNQLIFNDIDIDTLDTFAINLNPHTGEFKKLGHEIYHVSPDGKYGASSDLKATYQTQYGYGITVPLDKIPTHTIDTEDDGVWVTDTQTGETKMILSLKEIFEKTHTEIERKHYRDGTCYVFHTKWSPDSKRLMFTTRYKRPWLNDTLNCISPANLLFCVYTCNPDGSNLEIAIDETQWVKGGHHTTWEPNSEYLTMNLNIELTGLRLCKASLTGRHIEKLIEVAPGSGHPSYHYTKNIMISDSYEQEPVAYGDGTVPIRVIDFDKGEELDSPIRINVGYPERYNNALRVDPHVVWDKTGKYCLFNGHTDGGRRIFIADMSKYVGEN